MRTTTRTLVAGLAAVALLGAAPTIESTTSLADPVTGPVCDELDPALCLLPFPNDRFTVEDPTTATGRRVNLHPLAMPRNGTDQTTGVSGQESGGEGKPVDPTEWNRNDGFSPGSMVLTYVPGLDLHATWGTQDRPHSEVGPNEPGYYDHRDHIADIGMYQREDAPIVLLDADTGERHPFWSELDQHAATPDDQRLLIVRPARNLTEGHRYIVALRDLKDTDGTTIEARESFSQYRDARYAKGKGHVDGKGKNESRGRGRDNDRPEATGRAAQMEDIFDRLGDAGIEREELYLAWDFTVASADDLAGRMLHIRDDAFAQLGDTDLADREVQGAPPAFVVESTEVRDDGQWGPYRRVSGRLTVPNYLDRPQQTVNRVTTSPVHYNTAVPGSRLYYDPTDGDHPVYGDGLPDQNPLDPTVQVTWTCDVPLDGPSYGVLYGHGLLGTQDQIGDAKWPRRYGFASCATDWWGMASEDLPTVAAILADLSNFPSLPDRAQQGFLNFLYLGRAMAHPDGLSSDPAFQDEDGSPLFVVDRPGDGVPTQLYYDGNSQGGIMGGSLVAVSPDVHRGILGVPGMNYSTLLNRSVDWEGAYGEVYYATYQHPMERQLGFALIQMLWDRGEANGYAAHLTDDPYPNTPAHEVILQVAFSDHQVTNVAAEVEARTIGAPIMTPGLPEGRHWEMDPYFAGTATYPYQGSALIYWDSGNATPPNANIPADHNGDPHGDPRNEPAGGWQEAHFLLTGWMQDVCGGRPYLTDDHPDVTGEWCVAESYTPGG